MALGLVLTNPIVHAMGASPRVAPYARTYLRISLLGAPFVLARLYGMGRRYRGDRWLVTGATRT